MPLERETRMKRLGDLVSRRQSVGKIGMPTCLGALHGMSKLRSRPMPVGRCQVGV